MQQKSYQTGRQFVDDVKWFVHHCQSVHRQQEEIKKASEVLMNNVTIAIRTLDACAECYDNLYDFYVKRSVPKPCSKPHLLVWVKEQMYGFYWPAKVLTINADKKSICVQSFGGYVCWESPVTDNNCYLYSEEIPERKGGGRPKYFTKALNVSRFFNIKSNSYFSIRIWLFTDIINLVDFFLQEVDEYATNIRSKFGNCNYAKPRVAFEFGKMEEYLEQMVAKTHSDYYYTSKKEKRSEDSSRKRSSKSFPVDFQSAKQARSSKSANPIENALRIAQRFVGDKDEKIERLEEDLRNAKKNLEQSNARFAVEKKVLEDDNKVLTGRIAALELELCNQSKTFAEVKKTLTDMNMAFVSAKDKDKDELKKKNKALVEKNAALKKELDDERKKSAEGKMCLEQAMDYLKKMQ